MADDLPDAPWAKQSALPDAPWTAPAKTPQTFGEKLAQTWPVQAAKSLYEAATTPGDVATGAVNVQPTKPGMWSDEDEARLQATNATIADRARTLATMGPTSVAARAGEGVMAVPTFKPGAAPSIGALKDAAVAGYKSPEVQAVRMSSAAGPKLADEIIGQFNHPEVGIDENVAPKTFGILNKLYNVPDDAFLTVNNLRTLRRTLGNAAASPDATERLAAKSAQQHVDEFLAGLNERPDLVIQGDPKAAAGILKEANANYAAMSRAAELDTRLTRAQLRAAAANSGMNVANTIRQRMADVLVNPKLARGFTSDELALMQGIVEGKTGDNLLRTASNILGGGGGALSAIWAMGGHGLAPVAGYMLRRTLNARTEQSARLVNEALRRRSPLFQQQPLVAAEPGLLSRGPARMALPSTGPSIGQAIQALTPAKAEPEEDRRQGVVGEQKHGGRVQRPRYTSGGGVHPPHTRPLHPKFDPASIGARKARNGHWYVSDPHRQGRYLKVLPQRGRP